MCCLCAMVVDYRHTWSWFCTNRVNRVCRCLFDEFVRSYSRVANLDSHKAEVHNGDGERRRHRCRRCGRNFASCGWLVDHMCCEQLRPQPRVLVRDCNYDDSTLNAPPTVPPELSEVYSTNLASTRSICNNRRYQDILNCRLLRVAGDTDQTLHQKHW